MHGLGGVERGKRKVLSTALFTTLVHVGSISLPWARERGQGGERILFLTIFKLHS